MFYAVRAIRSTFDRLTEHDKKNICSALKPYEPNKEVAPKWNYKVYDFVARFSDPIYGPMCGL